MRWFIVLFKFLADRVFGPHTTTQDVYDVAAKPVVKSAMEVINGMALWNELANSDLPYGDLIV